MRLFFGVHEVRLLRPNGVSIGYFDDWSAALEAVSNEPSQYKAAYFSLNPIKVPDGISLNPRSLNPATRATADADIERRVSLLIDLDPPRPAGTNATESEKQAALEQAERVREWLRSKGWPEPVVADSGNGIHLLYRIELPNNEKSSALIKSFLNRLHQLFPMVDPGNFNASRITKLYDSWARKGPHTEERPHRRSCIVEAGSGIVVTEQQIQALAPTPVTFAAHLKADDVKLAGLLGFLEHYAIALRSEPREVSGGWQVEIECPWSNEHSDENRRDTVATFIAGRGYGFSCLHSHCRDRHWREFRKEVENRNPGLSPYFGKLPPLTHSDIARSFIEDHDDFVRVYDLDNATGVWMAGKRWTLSDQGDVLLRRAIRQYLDQLFDRYGEQQRNIPGTGKKENRWILRHASFVSGVLAEVKPWLPPKSSRDFDADASILPLPNGKVADLRFGTVREMRREDCQTKRLTVTPSDVPTPRWDRFLLEIACGDEELAAFIVRLFALSITGLSLHHLIFFYGRGRNGKGASLRLLERILGQGIFSVVMKPGDVEFQNGSENRDKRLMGSLRGMRMAFTGETVGGNLDWTLCKTLTGGDTLKGAKLYQDEAGFAPSHTMFLLTNDRPRLPPTAAFKGRLVFVPFDADFTDSKDMTLEDDLKQEMPGILWKLIQTAPAVFERGVEPPSSVLDATADVMDENDVARPFIEQCLIGEVADWVTPIPEMKEAIRKWCGPGLMLPDRRVDRILQGVRAKWNYGRMQVNGVQTRGLIGVRVRPTS
jgi:P4 family phage/plasmid primase-like protien